jgi:predicted DCC family thiol-disulfide oxidoreductase YuxK
MPLLLYDETCSVCRRFVSMAVKADRAESLRIAPLQGARGEAIRRAHPEHAAMDSALWVGESAEPLARSDAILAVADHLGGGWRLMARAGRIVPRPVRDWMYTTFASNRRYFGWMGLDRLDERVAARMVDDDRAAPGRP